MVPRVPSGKRKGHLGWVCAIRKVCRVTVAHTQWVCTRVRLGGQRKDCAGVCRVGPGRPCPSSELSRVSRIGVYEVRSCVLGTHSESSVKLHSLCAGGMCVVHLGVTE